MDTPIYGHIRYRFDMEAIELRNRVGIDPDFLERRITQAIAAERAVRQALAVPPQAPWSYFTRLAEDACPGLLEQLPPLHPSGPTVTVDVTLYDVPGDLLTKLLQVVEEGVYEGTETLNGKAVCKNEAGLTVAVLDIEDSAIIPPEEQ